MLVLVLGSMIGLKQGRLREPRQLAYLAKLQSSSARFLPISYKEEKALFNSLYAVSSDLTQLAVQWDKYVNGITIFRKHVQHLEHYMTIYKRKLNRVKTMQSNHSSDSLSLKFSDFDSLRFTAVSSHSLPERPSRTSREEEPSTNITAPTTVPSIQELSTPPRIMDLSVASMFSPSLSEKNTVSESTVSEKNTVFEKSTVFEKNAVSVGYE